MLFPTVELLFTRANFQNGNNKIFRAVFLYCSADKCFLATRVRVEFLFNGRLIKKISCSEELFLQEKIFYPKD